MSSDFVEPAGSLGQSNGYLLIIAFLIFGYLCVHARAPSVTGQTNRSHFGVNLPSRPRRVSLTSSSAHSKLAVCARMPGDWEMHLRTMEEVAMKAGKSMIMISAVWTWTLCLRVMVNMGLLRDRSTRIRRNASNREMYVFCFLPLAG
jgi:hypothetical protein